MKVEERKIERFVSGSYGAGYEYKFFIPEKVNYDWIWESKRLTMALEEASSALSALDTSAQFVPDINLFIRMHVFREASASSRIEGTHTEFEEAVLPENAVSMERRDDWREVNNYVRAMSESIEKLEKLPLSMRLLREAHSILLSGVRGKNKTPGEFRRSQNWVGGSTIRTARYIPPAEPYLPDLLTDLESFWHNEDILVPDLIRCAISHYQFETIHPFLDGNGRIGRLFIPFYLIAKNKLRYPCLYISSYLESHRDEYYEGLTRVRTENALEDWIVYFLKAVQETSIRGRDTFRQIFALRDEINAYCMSKRTKSAKFQLIFKYLYSHPYTTVNDLVETLSMDYQSANACVKTLVSDGKLNYQNAYRRNRIFAFERYLSIFAGIEEESYST